ncbi:TetR family transcriptional regulator [Streptomyces sp. NPDC002851]
MRQERAARTRQALLRAAALEFDRNGYSATSLARISQAAGISMGALTFHFSNKAIVANAVQTCGESAVLDAVDRVAMADDPPLQTVINLSVALVMLLEEEVPVRAATRLFRECQSPSESWTSLWAPALLERLREAARRGELRPGIDPVAVSTLAVLLVSGAETWIRDRAYEPADEGSAQSAVALLTRVWRLALRGLGVNDGEQLLRRATGFPYSAQPS